MRQINCTSCGKTIQTAASGPFKCNKCQGEVNKAKPKQGGTSGG